MIKKSLPLLAILAISLAVISAAVVYENARASTPLEPIEAESVDIALVKENVASNISAGKMADAKAQFDVLLANAGTDSSTKLSTGEEVIAVIYDLSEKFRFANNFETALQGHQYILDYYPEHKDAILAQKSLAATYIWAGDVKSAEAVTDELYEKFAGDTQLGESAFWVADTYYWRNFFGPAKKYYDKVIEEFAGSEAAMSAQRAIATMCMAQKDEAGADAAIDAYMANYGHMEKFPQEMMLIAGRYGWDKKFEKAFEYYDYIAEYYPGSDFGKLAGYERSKAKARMFMNAQDEPNAIVAIDEFIAKYATDKELEEVTSKTGDYARFDLSLMEIAKQLGWEKRYDSALKYFDYMAENFADEGLVADASLEGDRLRVIRIEDTLDEPNSLIAIDEFIAKHGEHSRVAEVTLEFAQYYDWKNEFEPNAFTQVLLNKVIDIFPESKYAVNANMDISRMEMATFVDANEHEQVFEAIDKFIADYNDYPEDAGKNLHFIRKKYYDKAIVYDWNRQEELAKDYYRKTVEIDEKFLANIPRNEYTMPVLAGISVVYGQELGEYNKGVFYNEQLVEKYPNKEYADLDLNTQAIYYNAMKRNGMVAPEVADSKIEKAYNGIIERFPQSNLLPRAATKLGDLYLERQEYEKAIHAYTLCVDGWDGTTRSMSVSNASVKRGLAFERMGDKQGAINAYNAFIAIADANDNNLDAARERVNLLLEGGEK